MTKEIAMAELTRQSVLPVGGKYAWRMKLVLATPQQMKRGGDHLVRDEWGNSDITATGITVQHLIEAVQGDVCSRLKIHPSLTTVAEFSVTSV
jgi:hypothetical protein